MTVFASVRYRLVPEHKGKDAAIIQMASGAIKYTCLHNTCQQHTWQEVRQMLDPHAYDRQYQPQPQYRPQPFAPKTQSIGQQQQPTIKPETPELGKKWFSMKDITKVNINELEHFYSGFKELDKSTHGLFYSSLTIVSGSNASGKSSWLNSLMLNAINQGQKCALWSGELRPDVLKTWIQMVAAGKDFLRQSPNGQYWYVPNDIATKIDDWTEGKFFLYNNEYSNKWEQIFADMKELLAQGVRIFILDNLFSLDIDVFDGDSNKKQKELINQLTDFKKKYKAHIILVAHPRKTTSFIRKNDISGTGDIINIVDNCVIMHRTNEDFIHAITEYYNAAKATQLRQYGNVLSVEKNRLFGVVDYMCGMHYEIESRRFKNAEYEDKQYGWERMEYEQTSIETPTPDVSYHEPRHETAVFKEDAPIDTGVPFAPPAMDDEPPF